MATPSHRTSDRVRLLLRSLLVVGFGCGLGGMGWAQTSDHSWGTWPAFAPAGCTATPYAMAIYDDGTGPTLHAVTYLTPSVVSKWTGSGWMDLPGLSTPAYVNDLIVFDDGSGPSLFAGGVFAMAGSTPANGIARWDGTSWHSLGNGFGPIPGLPHGGIYALEVFDDGTGPALYAAGPFSTAGAVSARGIAKWNGVTWTPLGMGAGGPFSYHNVRAIKAYHDGTSAALYAAGYFPEAGGLTVNNIAKWNGVAWSPLGAGITGSNFPYQEGNVRALAVLTEAGGTSLFAAGSFTTAGFWSTENIARWNGSDWSPVGVGYLGNGLNGMSVDSLGVANDGTGLALYASGILWSAQGFTPQMTYTVPVHNIAKWDGANWSALGSGVDSVALDYLTWNDGGGPAVLMGGYLCNAGGLLVQGFALWGCRTAAISLTQPAGPGAACFVTCTGLMRGRTYRNIFSFEPCAGGPGTGPYLGLCASNVYVLVDQLLYPADTLPFHFTATGPSMTLGPYSVPPVTADAVSFDLTLGVLGTISAVARFAVQ